MKMEGMMLTVKEKQAAKAVLVFSTSIEEKDIDYVKNVLDKIPGISEWNVDLEDWEKVLRIEAFSLDPSSIIQPLSRGGVHIQEMF